MGTLDKIFNLLGPVAFLFLVCMAFSGWFGFFLALERIDAL